nr:glucosamine-6-phosphate deaminase [Clostridiales bacterium]
PLIAKVVPLDQTCRMQQVHDGCFSSIDEVPTHAITLTVPTLMSAPYVFCIVPAPTKADAVYATVNAKIEKNVPSTILRTHKNAIMYLDADSSKRLNI